MRRTDELVRRDGAQPGDLVGVTGTLGGAGAGLLLLEREDARPSTCAIGERLLERHLRPRPLLEAGRALAHAGVHAMIDVSDGVASDLARLCERSGVAVEVRLADLPLEDGVAEVAGRRRPRSRRAGGDRGRGLRAAVRRARRTRATGSSRRPSSGGLARHMDRSRCSPAPSARTSGSGCLTKLGAQRRLRGWDHLSPAGRGATLSRRA